MAKKRKPSDKAGGVFAPACVRCGRVEGGRGKDDCGETLREGDIGYGVPLGPIEPCPYCGKPVCPECESWCVTWGVEGETCDFLANMSRRRKRQ